MQYRYEIEPQDYSDLASGRVFYSLPGHPAFPVRLTSEIFQRCMAQRETIYHTSIPCTLYDPCCGAAYHLSVLGSLHGRHIREIIASDMDQRAVDLAKRNLELLSFTGLDQRIHEITTMIGQYDKDSHREALKSAQLLQKKIAAMVKDNPIQTKVFQANATDKKTILENMPPGSVDIVFTDVPYGQHSQWLGADEQSNPLWSTLDALAGVLSLSSIVAVCSDKKQKVVHEKYQRLEQFQVGKRRVVIFRLV
jgi:16S rRNA G966 N2-methylase RsmD